MSSITFSNENAYDVYLGFWTNWSYGRIRGGTITLSRNNGSLLIAFLALFVAAAGKSFWRILCFALHQTLSAPAEPQDGFYHQRQAILRNSESALQGGWQLLNSMTVWKQSRAGKRVCRRGFPIIVTAITLSCGFALAGIFSSRVSSGDANEVLLSGRRCGYANREIDYATYTHEYTTWSSQRSQEYLFYARTCYQNTSDAKGCNIYVKPRLQLQSDQNASCPFSDSICISKFGNLRLDTGFINTHKDLGINTAPTNRLQIRHIYQCAPVKTEGYSKVSGYVDGDRNNSTTELFRLFYGGYEGYSLFKPAYTNFTYQVPVNASTVNLGSSSELMAPSPDYLLGVATSWGNIDSSAFNISYVPITQLQVPDSDVILFFLSAPDLNFQQKIDDPWFSAHKPGREIRGTDHGQEQGMTYLKDEPATVLGCTRQVQYCRATQDPDDQRCEPLRGLRASEFKKVTLGNAQADELAQGIDDLIMANFVPIDFVVDSLGSTVLVARSSLSGSMQGDLPSNQWQIELENLVSSNLAAFQGQAVDAVNGPQTPGIAKVWSPFDGSVQKELCKSQKVRSTQYPSFNVLGLSLILAIGSLLILLDLLLEPLIWRICKSRSQRNSNKVKSSDEEKSTGKKPTSKTDTNTTLVQYSTDTKYLRRSEWNATSTLQLQRMAHEAVGVGTWRRASSEIPVTLPNQALGTLDFMRPPRFHPYLIKPTHTMESRPEKKPASQTKLDNVSPSGDTNDKATLEVVGVDSNTTV